jgi:hypothetical protein
MGIRKRSRKWHPDAARELVSYGLWPSLSYLPLIVIVAISWRSGLSSSQGTLLGARIRRKKKPGQLQLGAPERSILISRGSSYWVVMATFLAAAVEQPILWISITFGLHWSFPVWTFDP